MDHLENKVRIEAYTNFPARIAKLCVQHVKMLGLRYGAIDLVLDTAGKFWFLENNPNGQWAFIEAETRQPIGKALSKMLAAL